MNIRFCLLLVSLILLASCKKKLTSFIEIGNKSGMLISTLNYTKAETWIDVNNDHQNDLEFASWYAYSPGGGAHGEVKIHCLNNKFSLMGNSFDDTTFVKTYTVIHKVDTMVYVEKVTTCFYHREQPNDSIGTLNHYPFKIKALNPSSIVSQNDNFMNFTDNLQVADYNAKYSIISKDTVYNTYTNSKFNPFPYPFNKEIYFGFKINEGNVVRLGWIKFKINGLGSVTIIESAIQNN